MSYKHEWSVVLYVFIHAESIPATPELIKCTKISLIEMCMFKAMMAVQSAQKCSIGFKFTGDWKYVWLIMSSKKKCKLIHGESLRSSTPSPHSIDWSLCALCQEQTDIPLTCPGKSLRPDIGSSYDTLGNNLSSFRDICKQSVPVDLNRLDDGDGIANTLSRNQAKWHTSCLLKCSTNRLAWLRPSTSATSDDGSQPYMQQRAATNTLGKESSTCFLCDELEHMPYLYKLLASSKIQDRI